MLYVVLLVGVCEGLHNAPAGGLLLVAMLLTMRGFISYAGVAGASLGMMQCYCRSCESKCGA